MGQDATTARQLAEAYLDALGSKNRRKLLAALDSEFGSNERSEEIPGMPHLQDKTSKAFVLPAWLIRALRSALADRIAMERPGDIIAELCRSGHYDRALGELKAAGGPFFSMINGIEASRTVASHFPEIMRDDCLDLALLDAVNALKSGNTPMADLILEQIGRRRRVPGLEECDTDTDVGLVCFLYIKAIYEDQPLSDATLASLSRILRSLPADAALERGLLYNVGLDVYMRKERFAMAEEAGLRALHHFSAADAPGLEFYILLYLAVIALGSSDLVRAQSHLADARGALRDFESGSDNDALLLHSFELIVAYEGGETEPLIRHLSGGQETVPIGELWPAMAEPILSYGRRALATAFDPRSALSWVQRWRFKQWRSQQFDRLISVQEALACQDAQRWQAADEILDRVGAGGHFGFEYWLARHASALDRAPKSEELARVLHEKAGSDALSVRQLAMVRLLLAQSAAARGMDRLSVRTLDQIVEAAGPSRLPRFLTEQGRRVEEILRHRGVAALVRRRPQLNRVLGAVRGRSLGRTIPEGLTRREHRVLLLVAEDLPNKAIAQRLGVSMPTVKFHVGNLLRKAGVRNRQALADHGAASGWLE